MFEWAHRRIRDLLETSYAGEWGAPPSPGNARVLRATDIDSDGRINGQGALRRVSPAIIQTKRLQRGDIILEASGGSPEKPVGRVAFFFDEGGELPCLTSNFYKALRPANDVEPRFLHWALLRFYRQPDMLQFQQQTTGIINLKFQDYLDAKIYAPVTRNEQKLIARILDTLDTQIQKTEALIAKLEKVKEGLLHDLLTRGIDENGLLRPSPEQAPELYKKSPLGLTPREWSCHALAETADVQRGRFTHRPRNDPAFYGGDYPFIQTGDVAAAKGGIVSNFSQTLSRLGTTASTLFPAQTIAITIAANIADTAILGRPMYFPDSVVGAIAHDSANARYIELCIRKAKRSLDARAPQSAQKNINLQDLRPLLIPFPSLNEQNRIAESYEAFMNRVLAERGQLTKLKLEKIALMDDLLTGRVRVTPLLDQAQATTPA